VYVRFNGKPLFCNLYTILVGPPGVGKTQALLPARSLLSGLGDSLRLSPQVVSKEKFIQILSKSTKMLEGGQEDVFSCQSAVACFVGELGTFIQSKDYQFMTTLTSLWDNEEKWVSATLARDEETVRNVYVTMLSGTTPKAIGEDFGVAAFGKGFVARVNFIFSDSYTPPKLFTLKKAVDLGPLSEDLRTIHNISGELTFTKEAEELFQKWVDEGMLPAPNNPRFHEYLIRRWLHLGKLCVLYSVAEGSSMVITRAHYEKAKDTLLEAERGMNNVFEFVGASNVAEALRNAASWLRTEYEKSGLPIEEARLKQVLLADISPQHLDSTVREIVASGYARMVVSKGIRTFVPA
jgi:hypothetical protein